MIAMNTLLTKPAPVTKPTGWKEAPALSDGAPARRLTAVDPRARILYVDDEPAMRRLGGLMLVTAGYDVHTAADGAEAWTALQEVNYHLLITDNDMPRLTGLELAAHARRAGMRLPIVMTSGFPGPLRDPAHAWLDLAAFLLKPFASDVLIGTVEQALHAANSVRQCSGVLISALAHIARVQPFPHGGINE